MAEFLTVNLKSILNNQKAVKAAASNGSQQATAGGDQSAGQVKNLKQIKDWGAELKQRLGANNSLSHEAREDEHEIESKFFEDFFKNAYPNVWDAACAEQLMLLGEPLKKALKVLGFNKDVNPILGFILNPFVVTNLIKTRLLNINTFKAIYNAVAKKLVADSEFFKHNDYNIIYCLDLYKKPVDEIMEYLKRQRRILDPAATSYSAETLEQNKRIFMAADGKLNSLELVKSNSGEAAADEDDQAAHQQLSSKKQQAIINKIDSKNPAEVLAMAQFLYMTTNSSNAKKALAKADFAKSIDTASLIKASKKIAGIMPKNQITDTDADSIIHLLFDK